MGKREGLRYLKENVIVDLLIPGGTDLAFYRARREKEVWEAEERTELLQAERAAQASSDLEALKMLVEQHHEGGKADFPRFTAFQANLGGQTKNGTARRRFFI
jgi:DNA-directed RNA polymerase subunit beta'